jgi:hypothetical protein
MRHLAVCLAAALVIAMVAPAFAQPFSDVPPSHWAYDAIAELSSQGIVQGFPDGTFRGNRAMTRFEMAVIVARLLARIESIQIPAPTPAAPTPAITPENLQQVQRLVEEFRGELTALGVRVTAIEEELNALKAKQSNVLFTGAYRFRQDDFREPACGGGAGCGNQAGGNGNPRVFQSGDSGFPVVPRSRYVAKLEFDGSVAPDVHLIGALLSGNGAPGSAGYAVFNSSTVGPTTMDSLAGIDNLFFDWKNMFGWPLDIWLGRFGGTTQIAYGSHPVQFGPFGLLMNTTGNTWEDSTFDSGFNVADGLRVAGHWPDLLDLQTQAVYIRITGGSGGTYFSGEDAYGLDANVKIASGLRIGAYYVGNMITGSPASPAPAGSNWHLYEPSGAGISAPGPNCNTTGITTGFQCPALGSGWGGYAGWDVMQGIHLDGEYASWQDGVHGTSDNGWQVMANLNLGTMTGWGHNLSLQAGYLDYGANFYPPYGAAEADILGNMNDTIYPGNAQGFVGLLSFNLTQEWVLFASAFTGNSVSPSQSEFSYAGGVRWLFSPRAAITIYTRGGSINGQEQFDIYRAQLDYNF